MTLLRWFLLNFFCAVPYRDHIDVCRELMGAREKLKEERERSSRLVDERSTLTTIVANGLKSVIDAIESKD